jgi:hypothetical protein
MHRTNLNLRAADGALGEHKAVFLLDFSYGLLYEVADVIPASVLGTLAPPNHLASVISSSVGITAVEKIYSKTKQHVDSAQVKVIAFVE